MEIEDEVIRHEVVGGDHGDDELFGSPDQGAPYKEMALGVHHVRADTPYLLEDVAEEEGRRGEAEARVEGHWQRARPALDHPVSRHHPTPQASGGAEHVDLVAPVGERHRQTLGEVGGAVHVRRVGIVADNDLHLSASFRESYPRSRFDHLHATRPTSAASEISNRRAEPRSRYLTACQPKR